MSTTPVDLLVNGEPFDDFDGFLYDYGEHLSRSDKDLLDDLIHGRKASGYIGGGHLPVWFVCSAEPEP